MRSCVPGLACLLLLSISPVSTQAARLAVSLTPPFAVPLEKVIFTWPWTQGDGDAVWFFTVKCGTESGTYPRTVKIPDPTIHSVALSSIITEPGQYFCVTSAMGTGGESANSEEIEFTVLSLEVS